jgi:hypothetical protein
MSLKINMINLKNQCVLPKLFNTYYVRKNTRQHALAVAWQTLEEAAYIYGALGYWHMLNQKNSRYSLLASSEMHRRLSELDQHHRYYFIVPLPFIQE